MKDKETVKNWIFLADGDLKTAEDELMSKNPFTNTICFHSQQSVEKYLKAYLSLVGEPFGKTHDIAQLIELCKKYENDFEKLYELKAHKLTRYAVDVRYTDDFYIPTIEEAEESIKIAKNVKKFVLQKIRKHKIMQKE